MPKRKDLKKILVIGAGPIIIGQACEFDYSGTQACKALRDEGYKVILINSNPATIMTDPDLADKTYIEPITVEIIEMIIARERPSAILSTMGGQTALNMAIQLEKEGILKKYKVELIGANSKAISNAEDRGKFRKCMKDIDLDLPKSKIITSIKEAKNVLKEIGLPAIVRPSFTLGGTGGGIAYGKKEYYETIKNGWITKKKNIITQHAKYENIVYMHDYVFLHEDWYKHFFNFGSDWDICMTPIINTNNRRYRDWTTWDHPNIHPTTRDIVKEPVEWTQTEAWCPDGRVWSGGGTLMPAAALMRRRRH